MNRIVRMNRRWNGYTLAGIRRVDGPLNESEHCGHEGRRKVGSKPGGLALVLGNHFDEEAHTIIIDGDDLVLLVPHVSRRSLGASFP